MRAWGDFVDGLADVGRFIESPAVIGAGGIAGGAVGVYKGARIVASKLSSVVSEAGDAVGAEATDGLISVGVDAGVAADVGTVAAGATELGIVMVEL